MTRASLKKNALWALAGNIVYAGTQWGILIVLAKLLSPGAVGEFSLGLAICAPVFGFANLQLRAIQATDVRTEWSTANYVTLRLITSVLAITILTLFVQVQNYEFQTTAVILLIAVSKVVESLADILYGVFQKNEDLKRISISLVQRGVLGLAFIYLAVAFSGSVALAALSLAIAWCVVLIFYDLRKVRYLFDLYSLSSSIANAEVSLNRLSSLAKTALPMGMVIGLNSLSQNIPRYFVADSLGSVGLGFYSAISYILAAVTVVTSAMGQAITPRLAFYYVNNRAAFARLVMKAMVTAVFVGLAGIAIAISWGREALLILYREEYGEYSSVLIWIMANAAMFGCVSVLGAAITASRSFRAQAVVSLGMVLISVVACLFLVPAFGLDGAAIAGVVALTFKLLCQTVHLFMLMRVRSVPDS